MPTKRDLFWLKLLWSVVVIFAVTLFAYIRYTHSDGIIGFDIYPYIFSPYVIGGAIIIFILGMAHVISENSFYHVLAGASNGYLSLVGAYVVFSSQVKTPHLIDLLFVVNGLIAAIILIRAYQN